jgi:hypothetical protein
LTGLLIDADADRSGCRIRLAGSKACGYDPSSLHVIDWAMVRIAR